MIVVSESENRLFEALLPRFSMIVSGATLIGLDVPAPWFFVFISVRTLPA
jgi:hypothetical protein